MKFSTEMNLGKLQLKRRLLKMDQFLFLCKLLQN